MPFAVLDILVGVIWCVLGVLLVLRGGQRRVPAALLLSTGATWLLGSGYPALSLLHRGPLIHLLVTYPGGRPRNRTEALALGLGYVDMLPVIGRDHWFTVSLAAVLVATTVAGLRRASGGERRARVTSSVICAALMVILSVGAVSAMLAAAVETVVVYETEMLAAGVALSADLRWGRWNRAAITSLVIDLGRSEVAGSVRDKLARALSDPTLELGFLVPGTAQVIDEAGREIHLSAADRGRQWTTLVQDDHDFAVVTHSSGALDDAALLGSVTALTGLALANARLQAAVLARVSEVESSRRRIVQVADRERKMLEAELQAGAEQTLAGVELLLDPADDRLVGLLRDSRTALTDFARGIHPRTLSEGGLVAACAELAMTTPVEISADIPDLRLAADIELSLYFVCAEALTNVVKYARAAAVHIRLFELGEGVRLTIYDDGCGGAAFGEPADGGTGLRGLADRLAVIGGHLTVDSPTGRGTTVTAEVPLHLDAS